MTPPTPPPQIDIVSVAIAFAALIFSPDLAALIGPYAVILIGATLGASVGASRRPSLTRSGTAAYIAGMVTFACLSTVPAAVLVSNWTGVQMQWLLGFVAAGIGALEPEWVVRKVRELARFKTGGQP